MPAQRDQGLPLRQSLGSWMDLGYNPTEHPKTASDMYVCTMYVPILTLRVRRYVMITIRPVRGTAHAAYE